MVVRATSTGSGYKSMESGFDSSYSLAKLERAGVKPLSNAGERNVSLLSFSRYSGDELWLGRHNFYVITRYNRSPRYAMAVYELSQEIKKGMEEA